MEGFVLAAIMLLCLNFLINSVSAELPNSKLLTLDCYECSWSRDNGGDEGCQDDFALDGNRNYIKTGCVSCHKWKEFIDDEQIKVVRECHTLNYMGNYCDERYIDNSRTYKCYCSVDTLCNSSSKLYGGTIVLLIFVLITRLVTSA